MKFAVATAFVALTVCGAALTQIAVAQAPATVKATDPSNTFSFDKPAKWPGLDDMTKGATGPVKEYVSGTADEECYFVVIQRPENAAATPQQVNRAWATALEPAKWTAALSEQTLLRGSPATVETSGVDTSKTFPVQTAVINGKNKVVAAIQARPGVEIWSLCTAYDGKDHTAQFQTIAASVSTPKDVEYKAAIDAQAAAAAAAAAPPAAAKK